MTGHEVKRLRKNAGLTQADLANLLIVDRMTVSRWERGVSPIGGPEAVAIRLLLETARPEAPIKFWLCGVGRLDEEDESERTDS